MGQDLLRLELGGPPKGGEKQKGGQEPKAPASDEQSTSSDPEPQKNEGKSEPESPPPSSERKPEPPMEDTQPSTSSKGPPRQKEPPHKPQQPKKSEHEPKDTALLGSREERRVSFSTIRRAHSSSTILEGENESHALAYLRTSKTISEHCGFFDNFQRSRHVEPDPISEAVQGRSAEENGC